jgi:hypothetical protein
MPMPISLHAYRAKVIHACYVKKVKKEEIEKLNKINENTLKN